MMTIHRNPSFLLASTLAIAGVSSGCADFFELGVVGVRKTFRVPIRGIEIDPPPADVEALVGPEAIESALEAARLDEEALGNLEGDLADHAGARVRLESLVVDALRTRIESAVQDELDEDLAMTFETDWSAWSDWRIDPSAPDASLEAALDTLPVRFRVRLGIESLSDLLGDEAEDVRSTLELLEAAYLDEVGLRTLAPDEVEPEGGWPNEVETDRVDAQLRDPARLDGCRPEQRTLEAGIAAEVRVAAKGGASERLVALEVAVGEAICGIPLVIRQVHDLLPLLDEGVELDVRLSTPLGVDGFTFGGYVEGSVEGRFRLPGSLEPR